MKRTYLILMALCLLCVPASAQTRQRMFDNFDTSRGVSVYRPPAPTPIVKISPQKAGKTGKNSKNQVASSGLKPLVKPTSLNRMSVTDGLADRELARTRVSSQPSTRLSMGSVAGMRGYTTGDATVDSYIVDSSRRYSIDPLLIYSQMHQESSFKLRATSYKGASGLMQLMPATARRLGVTNIYDPKQNIEGGVKYMRMLLDMFGQDINLALAGYNAGEGAVMKYGNTIPPYSETREYVRRISTRYMSISDGRFARTPMPRYNNKLAERLEKIPAKPLTIEQNAVAIRLADGRMRLVNQ